MTKEEVKALIKAKIEGQGSAIDAASVLPAILNGIMDLIDEGGGGTADAVQYIPQELTEAQQMQARKNQGLYYKEGETVSSLIWDGVPSEDDIHVHVEEYGMDYYLHRASSVAIPPSQMLGATVSWMANTTERSETITQGMVDTYESQAVSGAYNDGGAGFTVVLADSIEEPSLGITISRGVWFVGGSLDDDTYFFTKSIVLAEPYTEETISQIPPEYLEDAVLYSAQALTESEKMQARENLDLYRDGEVSTVDEETRNYGYAPDSSMVLQSNDYFVGLDDLTPCFYAGSSGKAGTEPIGQSGMVVNAAYLSERNGPTSSPAQVVEQTDDYIVLKANNHHAVIVWADSAVVAIPGLRTFTVPKGTFFECEIEGVEIADEEPITINYCVSAVTINYNYMAPTTIKVPSKYLPITKTLTASSTDEVVPSAKTVYNYIINNPPTGVVRYDASQSLNYTQKNQAIQNLGIENKIGSFITIDQYALENDWPANMSYDKMFNIIRNGGNVAASVNKNIEEIVDGFPEYISIGMGTFSGEIIGNRFASPRADKIVFSNVVYNESSLEIYTITFLPSSSETPSGTFAKYTFNATKTTTP